MQDLLRYLSERREAGCVIYPDERSVFRALELTPVKKVKAVILGQDPYHGPGQAHGLAFSVPAGCSLPPSLRNIFQELEQDLGCVKPVSGNLQAWAEQGVLLLNTVLTVEQGQAGAHQKRGWEQFTDRIIGFINAEALPSVFLLWGSHAQKKTPIIDQKKHAVLLAPHPSPLSAYRGFFGSRPFSRCNAELVRLKRGPISWQL